MNEDLSALVRAAARDEAGAAERELPSSSATLSRLVREVRRRRQATTALVAVAAAAVVGLTTIGVVELGRRGDSPVLPVPIATATSAPTQTPTPPSTPTGTAGEPSTPTPSSVEPSTTPPPDPTTTSSPKTTTASPSETAAVPAPGQITVVKGWTGGGSGEISVTWQQIPDATGYRVYRSESPDGPFAASAWLDVATGATTIEFSRDFEFIGITPTESVSVWDFTYTESTYAVGPVYFRVTGFDAGGEGPPSAVVCGTPPGGPSC